MYKLVVILVLVSSVTCEKFTPILKCSDPSIHPRINPKFKLETKSGLCEKLPCAITKEEEVNVTIYFTPEDEINKFTAHVNVIKPIFISQKTDGCPFTKGLCPIKPHQHTETKYSLYAEKFWPEGDYEIEIYFEKPKKDKFLCFDLTANVEKNNEDY